MSARTKIFFYGTIVLFMIFSLCQPGLADVLEKAYHSPKQVNQQLKTWAKQYPQLVRLHTIGKSSGGCELLVLEIARRDSRLPSPGERPAVFIGGNPEGTHLVATEAALVLAEKILSRATKDEFTKKFLTTHTVYLAPLLNPDAAQRYFARVKVESMTNARPIDDDLDELVDEDGPEDLNKDGFITQMRVKDPEGTWIPDPKEPRLLRRADPKKGEKGIYKVYTEGVDNDGDGRYNEDPPGGVIVCQNFPHDFDYNNHQTGLWPVSEPETIALLKFLTSHKNIGFMLNFSSENTILNMKQTGRAQAGSDKVRVPRRFATFLGLDPEKEYTLKELVNILKGMNIGGGMEIDESMIAMMLGLGPAMDLDRQDRAYLEKIQEEYKEVLKKASLKYPEKRAQGVMKGSLTAYAYFQYGVPVLAVDVWQVPEPEKKKKETAETLTVEKLKKMSSEDFLALGEEKIAAFLKEQGAPPNFKAATVMEMVKSGRLTPARMAEFMAKMPRKTGGKDGDHPQAYLLEWSDKKLKGQGFVNWQPFDHPTLGKVEIGGFVPFVRTAPPVEEIKKAVDVHTDFFLDMLKKLPTLEIAEVKVKPLADQLYKVEIYLTNRGWWPTSTAQGRRARTAWPIRVELKLSAEQKVFSGRRVTTVPYIEGSGAVKKVEWTIIGKKGSRLEIVAWTPRLGKVKKSIVLSK